MTTPQQPPSGPNRSQSSTSLSKLYQGPNGIAAEEENDPRLDFCNAFWGPGDRGYDVIMARLRGATRTIDELRSFWKERIAIEEEYAKKLQKLSKTTLGRDEIGDLHGSLQHVLAETAQQANYHSALSNELRQSVEAPTAEFSGRLANLRKGLQGSIEKAYKNKGLQEGHVNKAKERYEQDCLKLNSYTANLSLVQGKELEKIQQKIDRIRQTIGGNEQDFRQFVHVLEGTSQKWEGEWKSFCDHVQDMEEDRLALTKDLIWAYANAVSQVCVEDDGSCERIREKLEQFEPQNDMITFVTGWGTGDSIPDPPRFINYAAGETFSSHPTSHQAFFRRISSKPPMPTANAPVSQNENSIPPVATEEPSRQADAPNAGAQESLPDMQALNLSNPVQEPQVKSPPFGGVALPGMGAAPVPVEKLPERRQSMAPPPLPGSMQMPEPRTPSRQSQVDSRDVNDEEDPMARALANLRKEPPPPDSIRRNPSHRRPESVYSNQGSVRNSMMGGIKSPASPAPAVSTGAFRGAPSPGPGQMKSPSSPAPAQNNRQSFQQQHPSRQSVDMGLSPPPGGHTAAALARSMEDFQRQTSRDNRQSVNYSNFADDVVGAHPSSRPASPAPPVAARTPSPAMMQAPSQPSTHIADEVLSQYHQAFPGERHERSRSRANSITSRHSRAGSIGAQGQAPPNPQQPPPSPGRQGFAGIGAGGIRSPSPQPQTFRSPSPSPAAAQGSLGPQNIGISLDEKGGVAHDSMAEAYRRQYQQSQQQQAANGAAFGGSHNSHSQSQQGHNQQGYGQTAQSPMGRPASTYGTPMATIGGQAPGQYGQQNQHGRNQSYSGQQAPQQGQNQYFPSYSPIQAQPTQHVQQPPVQQAPPPQGAHAYQSQYGQQQAPQQQPQQYGGYQQQAPPQQQQYGVAQNQYNRSASPAPHNQYNRAASPAPPQQQPPPQQYGYRAPSPQPGYQPPQQQQQQMRGRSPSPQPNQPPANTAPTGQWSTTGQPVLFYVKALYDYTAQSAAEFDFQAGDIIAVTNTPEDGWWSGELLDEARRSPGRTDFPSNFVCLF